MLSYSPLTLPADRLFFDEETKKFYDKTTGDEVSGWNLADGYTVYAQISKGAPALHIAGFTKGGCYCKRTDSCVILPLSHPTRRRFHRFR